MDNKKIGIASDHAGYQLKEFVIGYLDSKGYDVYDFGTNSEESCDYPDYAHPLAEAIEKGELPRGIAMCGSANGITMTLNKHQGDPRPPFAGNPKSHRWHAATTTPTSAPCRRGSSAPTRPAKSSIFS